MKKFIIGTLIVLQIPGLAFAASPDVCGLSGSLNERIADCSKLPSSSKNNWHLVTRTEKSNDVWLDKSAGLLWGDLVKPENNGRRFRKKICSRNIDQNGNLPLTKFRIPTQEDYRKAIQNAAFDVVSKFSGHYVYKNRHTSEYCSLDTYSGSWACGVNLNDTAVRCVADAFTQSNRNL